MRPRRSARVRTKLLVAIVPLVVGCASLGHIPALEQSATPARYYRTQDVANFASGVGVDLAARLICHGPTQHRLLTMDSTGRWYPYDRLFTGTECPVVRVGLVGLAGLVRQQTDRGARISGPFMNVSGAVVTEILHLFVDAVTKGWGPPDE